MPDPIVLDARMDLAAVDPFVQSMLAQVHEGRIVLDGSAVTHMGALCAQAIISAARAVGAAGGSLEFTTLSERATQQLSCMGLTPQMLAEGAK